MSFFQQLDELRKQVQAGGRPRSITTDLGTHVLEYESLVKEGETDCVIVPIKFPEGFRDSTVAVVPGDPLLILLHL